MRHESGTMVHLKRARTIRGFGGVSPDPHRFCLVRLRSRRLVLLAPCRVDADADRRQSIRSVRATGTMYEEGRVAVLCCVETIEWVCVYRIGVPRASPPLVSKQTILDRVFRPRPLSVPDVFLSPPSPPPRPSRAQGQAASDHSLPISMTQIALRAARALSGVVNAETSQRGAQYPQWESLLTQPRSGMM
jgi:hypothetical protein